MPGSFLHLHQLEADGRCRIVSAADKLQLVRSSCNGTLASRIEELDVAMAMGRGVGGSRCAWTRVEG